MTARLHPLHPVPKNPVHGSFVGCASVLRTVPSKGPEDAKVRARALLRVLPAWASLPRVDAHVAVASKPQGRYHGGSRNSNVRKR